ncbi:basic proline-rich protein-like [Lemur catta]|uniref:basic proline-rich protein-like n=1 Tax=Lemur catta TaxID=9447 RepID=UPI001E26CAAA|nr:basic proline-rich protein-like [Lemur catta]
MPGPCALPLPPPGGAVGDRAQLRLGAPQPGAPCSAPAEAGPTPASGPAGSQGPCGEGQAQPWGVHVRGPGCLVFNSRSPRSVGLGGCESPRAAALPDFSLDHLTGLEPPGSPQGFSGQPLGSHGCRCPQPPAPSDPQAGSRRPAQQEDVTPPHAGPRQVLPAVPEDADFSPRQHAWTPCSGHTSASEDTRTRASPASAPSTADVCPGLCPPGLRTQSLWPRRTWEPASFPGEPLGGGAEVEDQVQPLPDPSVAGAADPPASQDLGAEDQGWGAGPLQGLGSGLAAPWALPPRQGASSSTGQCEPAAEPGAPSAF